MRVIALNLLYAAIGGATCIAAMSLGYRVLDSLTPFQTSRELQRGNVAVGAAVAGMFVGIGAAVGMTIGMALN